TQPTRFNNRMVISAQGLNLEPLVGVIESVSGTLRARPQARGVAECVRRGAADLGRLHERLMALIDRHNHWQDLLQFLQQLETALERATAGGPRSVLDPASKCWRKVQKIAN